MLLVTGATGTVGRELVKLLVQQGCSVRALLHSPEKAALFSDLRLEIAVADLATPSAFPSVLRGVKKAFLLTPSSPAQVQLESTFISAAQFAGVQHIVKLSTLGAKSDSPLAMGRWHWQAEQILRASGISWTILRCHNFMQNLWEHAVEIRRESRLRAPLGVGRISLVDARDLAAVAAVTLAQTGHEKTIYHLTGPDALSYHQLAQELSSALRRKIVYVDLPLEEARRLWKAAGKPDWLVADLAQLFSFFRANSQPRTTNDVFRLTQIPPRSFSQFARDYAEIFA